MGIIMGKARVAGSTLDLMGSNELTQIKTDTSNFHSLLKAFDFQNIKQVMYIT